MSEETPTGLPTRGTGMPMDRGGNRAQRRQDAKAADVQKRQEEARSKKILDFLNAKPTRREVKEDMDKLYGAIVALEDRSSNIGLRVEALIQTMVRQGGPSFQQTFEDAMVRMIRWRETVLALDNGDYNLREIQEKVNEWNSDPSNPTISISSFNMAKLLDKIINDIDMNREEKELFLVDLKVPANGIKSVFAEIDRRLQEQANAGGDLATVVSEGQFVDTETP